MSPNHNEEESERELSSASGIILYNASPRYFHCSGFTLALIKLNFQDPQHPTHAEGGEVVPAAWLSTLKRAKGLFGAIPLSSLSFLHQSRMLNAKRQHWANPFWSGVLSPWHVRLRAALPLGRFGARLSNAFVFLNYGDIFWVADDSAKIYFLEQKLSVVGICWNLFGKIQLFLRVPTEKTPCFAC